MEIDNLKLFARIVRFVFVPVVAYFIIIHFSLNVFVSTKHIAPEKVSCTILSASHDFVGWLGNERFSVVVEADGKIYEITDKDIYYLYCSKIGQSFPAELSYVKYFFSIPLEMRVYLQGNYGIDWKVNDLLYKQQNKEVSKKWRKL